MLDDMNRYYNSIKHEVGIDKNERTHEEDDQLDEILKTLKPNTTAKNFKDFLGVKDNCNKT